MFKLIVVDENPIAISRHIVILLHDALSWVPVGQYASLVDELTTRKTVVIPVTVKHVYR